MLQIHCNMRNMARLSLTAAAVLSFAIPGVSIEAKETPRPAATQAALVPLYQKYGEMYDVDWAVLAGIDRYAQLIKTRSERVEAPYYGFAFHPAAWAGIENPNLDDVSPQAISVFGGLGQDANGDMLALPFDQPDRIKTLAYWLDSESDEDDEVAVWNLFQDPIAVERVFAFARMFHAFGLNVNGHSFPLDKRYNYTIKHTFGARRSFGGRRIHEGVDIFADYGTPVLACSYGYVELMGWNRLGGWRIGIRDANNMYYYYGHLSAFQKGLRQGDLVRPGQVIGYVGSSGYGPPGTSGKFPPHLHFGLSLIHI